MAPDAAQLFSSPPRSLGRFAPRELADYPLAGEASVRATAAPTLAKDDERACLPILCSLLVCAEERKCQAIRVDANRWRRTRRLPKYVDPHRARTLPRQMSPSAKTERSPSELAGLDLTPEPALVAASAR